MVQVMVVWPLAEGIDSRRPDIPTDKTGEPVEKHDVPCA